MSRICDGCGADLVLPDDPSIRTFECRYCHKQHHVAERASPEASLDRDIGIEGLTQSRLPLFMAAVGLVVVGVGAAVFALRSPAPSPVPIAAAAPTPEPTPPAPAPAPQAPSLAKLELSFGGKGNGPGKFDRPNSLAVDREDFVYVVDRTNRVQKFDGAGSLIGTFPVETKNQPVGPLSSDIAYGIGIAVDSKQHLYVSIGYDIVVLDAKDGKMLRRLPGVRGATCYRQLTVDQTDHIYAVSGCGDSNKFSLLKLSPTGQVMTRFQEPPDYERSVHGKLAVDGANKLYAAHGYESEVQVLTQKGDVFTRLGHKGDGACEFGSPWLDAVVDSRGRLYVRDGSRVHVFESDGKCLGRFDTDDSGGAVDLAFGANDVLYVLTGKDVVAKYSISLPG